MSHFALINRYIQLAYTLKKYTYKAYPDRLICFYHSGYSLFLFSSSSKSIVANSVSVIDI